MVEVQEGTNKSKARKICLAGFRDCFGLSIYFRAFGFREAIAALMSAINDAAPELCFLLFDPANLSQILARHRGFAARLRPMDC
ncbi:MAG TPA: hypothetical protein PLY87_25350, partial [Planctomycetaceae bacterium]|nr:hypothetical protein [Planctomycetaceae bacterium]